MTREEFSAVLRRSSTGPFLDRALAADEALRQQLIRENNDRLIQAYVIRVLYGEKA